MRQILDGNEHASFEKVILIIIIIKLSSIIVDYENIIIAITTTES